MPPERDAATVGPLVGATQTPVLGAATPERGIPSHLTVTVVVPARDEATRLPRCLRSLAGQTLAPHEVVVVDNASRDSTAEIASQAGARVVHEPVPGVWSAAARGYDAAGTDLIARCDADSEPPPDWIERIVRAFEEDPGLQVLTGPGDFYDLWGPPGRVASWVYMHGYVTAMTLALTHPPVFGSNLAMRTEAWRRARPNVHRTRDDIHDDADLSYHLTGRMRFDWGLWVGISPRPLFAARRRRWAVGMRTVLMHWPAHAPWRRFLGLSGPHLTSTRPTRGARLR
ncbi:glycosyltransferase [Cellulomonas sp. P22]|uniref:glycosyltransferase n=1 Tax=Cellulomonas sp. P22 TaxID=3373189 RepID=UPI00378856BE